ncbi:hypothetical protein BOTBODRAFT_52406 [Botryobasidium botryosum FD-172 SS1]|uniref:Uncharacterized protein n=1 Tax=Botryobasidium botryosum (strain FD-172 SS1) TaxID=930990 RepID=A0A067MRK2_BOTB1|nr:hypothetical protein BOTBODRAFT_52406 [Botryobasidium botryosum FD-172 SS1]
MRMGRTLIAFGCGAPEISKSQWQDPSDILTVLTIIGGDIVQGALAQLVSSHPRPFTPVAFSFGWIAWSFSAIIAAIGSRRLMPMPDFPCTLIEVDTGYARDVNSWTLSRLVRDYELPDEIDGKEYDKSRGLTIAFFDTDEKKAIKIPDRDWVYWTGTAVIILQHCVAIIPGVLHGNWLILILTFGGTILVQLHAALPQWQQELWNAGTVKEGKSEVVCLTQGNGSQYVMVVRSKGGSLRLPHIAAARTVQSRATVPLTSLLAVLWLVHLFTVQGVKNDPWYLLLIGALGMVQNAIASGARRTPQALGFHLVAGEVVHDDKVMKAIQKAEGTEPKTGLALLDTFFPGGLRPDEKQWKDDMTAQRQREDEREGGNTVQVQVQVQMPVPQPAPVAENVEPPRTP